MNYHLQQPYLILLLFFPHTSVVSKGDETQVNLAQKGRDLISWDLQVFFSCKLLWEPASIPPHQWLDTMQMPMREKAQVGNRKERQATLTDPEVITSFGCLVTTN